MIAKANNGNNYKVSEYDGCNNKLYLIEAPTGSNFLIVAHENNKMVRYDGYLNNNRSVFKVIRYCNQRFENSYLLYPVHLGGRTFMLTLDKVSPGSVNRVGQIELSTFESIPSQYQALIDDPYNPSESDLLRMFKK